MVLPVPAPVKTPVVDPTDAIEELLLLHVASVVASVSVTVAKEQTADTPDIAAGIAFTVIGAVT